MGFRECAVVRFLDEAIIDPADIANVGRDLSGSPS
jgi:hypothetical protein